MAPALSVFALFLREGLGVRRWRRPTACPGPAPTPAPQQRQSLGAARDHRTADDGRDRSREDDGVAMVSAPRQKSAHPTACREPEGKHDEEGEGDERGELGDRPLLGR